MLSLLLTRSLPPAVDVLSLLHGDRQESQLAHEHDVPLTPISDYTERLEHNAFQPDFQSFVVAMEEVGCRGGHFLGPHDRSIPKH